jgi:hypothetical protein
MENPAKPPKPGNGGEDPYKTIGRWANTNLSAVVNLSSASVTDPASFLEGVSNGFSAWDAASGLTVSLSRDDNAVNSSYVSGTSDGKNVVSWGSLASYRGAIGITWIWRYVNTKEIFEADMVLSTGYAWLHNNITGDPDLAQGQAGYMDVQNIATHEFGHVVGLGDLRNGSEQTMYGFSNYAEVKKRSLEAGDITGVQSLYGS